jgi:hypothetical protein
VIRKRELCRNGNHSDRKEETQSLAKTQSCFFEKICKIEKIWMIKRKKSQIISDRREILLSTFLTMHLKTDNFFKHILATLS